MRTILFVALVCSASVDLGGARPDEVPGEMKPLPSVVVSESGDYVVRIKPGDGKERAKAIIIKFRPETETFVALKPLDLRNAFAPEFVFITDSGRYVVTLDDLHEVGRTSNAVVIYDREKDVSKAFAIEDFLSPRAIGRLPRDFSMRLWYTGWATLDNESLKLYPSGTDRNKDVSRRPLVVIDIARMAVGVVRGNVSIVQSAKSRTAMARLSANRDRMVRVQFGDGKRKARALLFTFDPRSDTYAESGHVELRNPIAPETILLTDDGRYLVTLDDLHEVGVTANAVVIYDVEKRVNRAFRIEDFLPAEVIRKIPVERGMRLWHGIPRLIRLDDGTLKVYPSGPVGDCDFPNRPLVEIDLAKMTVSMLPEK
jgi:hypothetical protein